MAVKFGPTGPKCMEMSPRPPLQKGWTVFEECSVEILIISQRNVIKAL